MIHGAQIKAARALLGWSQDALAGQSKVSTKTIARAESAAELPDGLTASVLLKVFAENGVVFVNESDRTGVFLLRNSGATSAKGSNPNVDVEQKEPNSKSSPNAT
jgi:transcriptional regulator with XRE-family HTH domain